MTKNGSTVTIGAKRNNASAELTSSSREITAVTIKKRDSHK